MKIAGFQKNSTIDFPGKLSCVVFAAGCNYDCYYCHNRHLLDAEEKVLMDEVMDFLAKRRGLIDGVVFTGGEPTLYEDVFDFIKAARDMGYSIKLDTNGTNPTVVKSLIEQNMLDYVAVDFKAQFSKYDVINACADTGGNEKVIKDTIWQIMKSGIDYEIRTTMIPEITEEDLISMAESFEPFQSFILQKYRPVPEDPGESSTRKYYKKDELQRLAELIKPYQPHTVVRA